MTKVVSLSERKDSTVGFRVSRDLKERAERAALIKGTTLSELASSVLTQYVSHFESKHNLNEINK